MYCTNCGNKVDENAYVCIKCGVIINKDVNNFNNINNNIVKVSKKKGDEKATGILSIVFSALAILSCFNCLSTDISEVGMYTEVYEKVAFAIGFNLFSIVFVVISSILSLVNRKSICNKIGLALSILAVFLIISEFVVIIVY